MEKNEPTYSNPTIHLYRLDKVRFLSVSEAGMIAIHSQENRLELVQCLPYFGELLYQKFLTLADNPWQP